MNYKRIVKATKVILDFMFYSGIVVFVLMPYLLKLAGEKYLEIILEHYIKMVFVITPAALFGVLILGCLRRMLKTVMKENCFVYENVRSLELMAVFSIVITVLFAVKLLFLPTIATVVLIVVFFIAALFSAILSYIFRDAVRYKEENDLTI